MHPQSIEIEPFRLTFPDYSDTPFYHDAQSSFGEKYCEPKKGNGANLFCR